MIKFPILAVWCCSCKSMQESSLDSQVAPTVFACMPSNRIGRIEKTVPTGEKQLLVSSKYFRAPTVSILRRCSYFCVSWASGAQVINLWRQRMLFVKLRGVRVRKVSWSQVWMLGVTLEVLEWRWVTVHVWLRKTETQNCLTGLSEILPGWFSSKNYLASVPL